MVPRDEVLTALDRLLASESFANAERLSRLLRFTVERSLAGEGETLKEYRLGTEVFDRSSDFDPRLDPIVRVEARRLRAKLSEYYEGPGREDPVRIALPKGAYVATFEAAAAPHREAPRRGLRWRWAALALVATMSVAGVIASRAGSGLRSVTLVIVPNAPDPQDQIFADSLAEAVSAELSRNPEFHVIAWQRFVEYRQQRSASAAVLIETAIRDLGAKGVLTLSVRRSGDRRRITAALMNPEEGWKQWAGEYERGVQDEFSVQREVARSIAEELRGQASKLP